MDRKTKQLTDTTTKFMIKIKLLVAVVVSCMLVAPLTRDQEVKRSHT